jgi:hypothetical protein
MILGRPSELEPPWGVEPQTYALRVRRTPPSSCSTGPSVHVKVFTVLRIGQRRTPLEATKEATPEIENGFERDRRRHPPPRHDLRDRYLGLLNLRTRDALAEGSRAMGGHALVAAMAHAAGGRASPYDIGQVLAEAVRPASGARRASDQFTTAG